MLILKVYITLHKFFHNYFKFNLRGLGWLFRLIIKKDIVLDFPGNKKIFINCKICDNYGRQLIGKFNEPETHIFINKIIAELETLQFVDIGANVGEFVLAYGDHPKVKCIHAFEPQIEQFNSLKQLVAINDFKNVYLNNYAISSSKGEFYFNIEKSNTSNSGLVANEQSNGIKVNVSTIDDYVLEKNTTTLFLIDIEGSEVKAMQGARQFIQEEAPIIIFEFNYVSRKHFSLDDVKRELGQKYTIFRLNRKGCIDEVFDDTWNLVAIPKTINFNLELLK